MGWARKQSRSRNTRFTDKQKDYLIAKFETGEQTGQKADAASVSRLMRSEKDENGEQLFDCSEFLTSRQISSFFLVWPQSEVSTTKRSTRAMTMNKSEQKRRASYKQWAKRWCLKFLFQHAHPILYNDYSICELVKNSKLSNFPIQVLNGICTSFGLDTSQVNVKRKKPYVDILTSLVMGCQCQANGEWMTMFDGPCSCC